MTVTLPHLRRTAATVAAMLLSLGAGGCLSDPYNDESATRAPTTASTAPAAPVERREGPVAPAEVADWSPVRSGSQPRQPAPHERDRRAIETVVRRFATRYVNWEGERLAGARRALASMAVGGVREELLDQARAVGVESARRPNLQANSGRVEGVLIQRGRPLYVIVRESTRFGDTPAQEGLFLYVAAVVRSGETWRISEWRSVSA